MFKVLVSCLFIISLVLLGMISNNIEMESLDFKFIMQNIFRGVLTGLIGYWVATIFKYCENLKLKNPLKVLKSISKKDTKWIYTKIEDFKDRNGDLHKLEYMGEDKVDEIEKYLAKKKFVLYFSRGSKSDMKSEPNVMKINETRIEMNTSCNPPQCGVEYFDGTGKYYYKIFIQK
ncbi:hypothetical protein AGMMS49940_19540 [Spirochaetia bacterium]|nr:hypothetical protein AGMMS49940_19540 [Spirochaetia bacterium]